MATTPPSTIFTVFDEHGSIVGSYLSEELCKELCAPREGWEYHPYTKALKGEDATTLREHI